MPRHLEAAAEINHLWISCLDHEALDLSSCPTNETVAAIIDRHCPQPPTDTDTES
jgi:hypothetical protein